MPDPATLAEKCCMGGRKRAGLADPRKNKSCKGLRGPARVSQTLADPRTFLTREGLQGFARALRTLAYPRRLETCEGLQGSARALRTLADPRTFLTREGWRGCARPLQTLADPCTFCFCEGLRGLARFHPPMQHFSARVRGLADPRSLQPTQTSVARPTQLFWRFDLRIWRPF